MTLKVKKSQVAGVDFAAMVNAHVAALNAHARHMANVESDPKNFEGYPAPIAQSLVTGAVGWNGSSFFADYDVEDDGVAAMRARKDALLDMVARLEIAARDAVDPPGKRRLNAIKIARGDAVSTPTDKLAAIDLLAAEMMAEVEDLTIETIDAWTPKEFPT